MSYKVYFSLITALFLAMGYRLFVLTRERAETDQLIKEVKWKNHRLQIVNKNIYYLLALEKQIDAVRYYFNRQQISNVAVYGMDGVGKACVQLLMNAGINVCYGIDKNKNISFEYAQIRQIENIDEQADLIIVAAEVYFKEISETIQTGIPIRKLSEVSEEILVTSHNY